MAQSMLIAGLATMAALFGLNSLLFVPSRFPVQHPLPERPELQQAGATPGSKITLSFTAASLGALASLVAVGGLLAKGTTRSRSGGTVKQSLIVTRAFENELGVQPPVGFFDPLGFARDGDEMKFKRRRASELKHGRLCMFACMGYITPEYFRFPGFLSTSQDLKFADMPNGLAALSKVPVAGGMQIFLWMGFIETFLWVQEKDRAPGDFTNAGALGVPFAEGIVDSERRKRSLSAELANGRLAMVAIMGMMFQNGWIGTTGPDMWIPASAFEGELGVQPPVGYFDPFGLSKDGDADTFFRRRCTEIKHGRVAMWAAMGYIVPEYVRWPGYLSPSADLKFTDVESGFAAFSKVPLGGWMQILGFIGFLETFSAKQDPANPPGMLTGNDGPFGLSSEFGRLGLFRADRISDPEAKKRALNSELANGRLAMFAIMGMMFQNGVIGTTGPSMWIPGA